MNDEVLIPEIEDIDAVNEQEPVNDDINANYQFADGFIDPDDSLEEFLEDIRKPKQETGAPEQPEEDEIENEDIEDDVSLESAKYTASFIVDSIDEIVARGLSFYSLNPVEEHRAGKEQKKYLKKLWTNLCKEKGFSLPPGTQIFIAMITIYGAQIPKADADRKLNLKLKRLKEDQERLDEDRQILEREKEQFERRRRIANNG